MTSVHDSHDKKICARILMYTSNFLKLTFYYTQHFEKSLLIDYQAVMKIKRKLKNSKIFMVLNVFFCIDKCIKNLYNIKNNYVCRFDI